MSLFSLIEVPLDFVEPVRWSSCGNKMIFDEVFSVLIGDIRGEGRHFLKLDVLCYLLGSVPAEKVRVVSRSFSTSSSFL